MSHKSKTIKTNQKITSETYPSYRYRMCINNESKRKCSISKWCSERTDALVTAWRDDNHDENNQFHDDYEY